MRKIITILSLTILSAQDPVSFSGESGQFILDGVPPEIGFTYPAGSETFYPGSIVDVMWAVSDDNPITGSTALYLFTASSDTISSFTNLNGSSLTVTIPASFGSHYFHLTDLDTFGNPSTANSGTFTIAAVMNSCSINICLLKKPRD